MINRGYKLIGFNVYEQTLSNGLRVYVLPRKGFYLSHAVLAVGFGSTHHLMDRRDVRLPLGTAHFLEHMVLNQPTVSAVKRAFAERGAKIHALTGFSSTVYQVMCVEHPVQHALSLFRLVTQCVMTSQQVDLEREVIRKEIEMYANQPLLKGLCLMRGGLFGQTHALAADVAGTTQSIKEIDPSILQDAHRFYYHPANMVLVFCGDFDPPRLIEELCSQMGVIPLDQEVVNGPDDRVKQNHRLRGVPDPSTERQVLTERAHVPAPLVCLGYRVTGSERRSGMASTCQLNVGLEALFGKLSDFYNRGVKEQWLYPSLTWEYTDDPSIPHAALYAYVPNVEMFLEQVEHQLCSFMEDGLQEHSVKQAADVLKGQFIFSLDDVQTFIRQYANAQLNGRELLQTFEYFNEVDVNEVDAKLRRSLCQNSAAILLPHR